MQMSTTTPEQDAVLTRAKKELLGMGPAAARAAAPVFALVSKLDDNLRAAILRIEEMKAELEARRDHGR